MKAMKAPLCQRCSQELHSRRLLDSMAVLSKGRIVSYICPDCLTLGEEIEMAVNEAMTEVGYTRDGRIMTRAKREGASQ